MLMVEVGLALPLSSTGMGSEAKSLRQQVLLGEPEQQAEVSL